MAYAEGQTDLSLRLFDGSIHQYRPTDPTGFQLTYFRVNDIRVKNVFDELQRNTSESIRGDREMSTCEMLAVIREADREEARGAPGPSASSCATTCAPCWRCLRCPDPTPLPGPKPLPAYCGWMESVQDARPSEDGGSPERHTGADRPGYPGRRKPAQGKTPAQARPRPGRPSGPMAPRPTSPQRLHGPSLSNWSLTATADRPGQDAERRAARYAVEVHKKWAISMACISFVIIGHRDGAPVPRGEASGW